MIGFLLRRFVEKHRLFIYAEAEGLQDFMALLMKHRNTGMRWTREEKRRLRRHFVHLALYVPALFIFLLPGGSLLLPVLAEILDRRKHRRPDASQP